MNPRNFDPTSVRDLATLLEALGIFLDQARRPFGGDPSAIDFVVTTRRNGHQQPHTLEEVLDHCEDVVEMVFRGAGSYDLSRFLEHYRCATDRGRRAGALPPVPAGLESRAKMIETLPDPTPTPPSAASLEAAANAARRMLEQQAGTNPLALKDPTK